MEIPLDAYEKFKNGYVVSEEEEEVEDYYQMMLISRKPCWKTESEQIHCWCLAAKAVEAKENMISILPNFYFSYRAD